MCFGYPVSKIIVKGIIIMSVQILFKFFVSVDQVLSITKYLVKLFKIRANLTEFGLLSG